SRDNQFVKEGYYTWIYLGSQRLSHLFTFLIIVGFLLVTCFPIWPRILKVRVGVRAWDFRVRVCMCFCIYVYL
ncbi:unnamed protein product, partial [Discosporangium mesarthrocarpum]